MPKNTTRRRVVLAEYAEKRNNEAGLEIETPDGSTFFIPAAELWPDDFPIGGTAADQMRSILGADDYDRFIAAGGNAKLASAAFFEVQGSTPGE